MRLKVRFTALAALSFIGCFHSDDDAGQLHFVPAIGALDETFGINGKVTTSIGSVGAGASSVAIQPDGKIVVAGSSYDGTYTDFAVARYNPDGSSDSGFDGDGKVTTDVRPWNDDGSAVAVQADGKIVVAGSSFNSTYYDFAIVRYNPEGSLDPTFGGNGMVITYVSSGHNFASSVVIQQDGRILVAGYVGGGVFSDFMVARYNPDGSLDSSFDSDGIVRTDISGDADYASDIAIQTDNKIVVAGSSSMLIEVVRYNPDGSLDPTFDSDGKVATSMSSGTTKCSAVAIQTDGAIVVAGEWSNGGINQFALVRYKPDGSLDATFDNDGKVTTGIGTISDFATSIAIQSDGMIVVTGGSFDGSQGLLAIARYNLNGSLDPSFGTNGTVTTAIGSGDWFAGSAAIQTDGKIVVVGTSSGNFAVVRYR